MILCVDNQVVAEPVPLFTGKDIVIGIDSSKTNTALAVGDLSGEVLHWIELNGAGDGTTEYDALRLCKAHRDTLKVMMKGCHIVQVGIEDIITKIKKGKETGMTVHSSRFKITCVFSSLISFFQDNFNITPILVNNWTWKSHILPQEFRARDVGKGSLAYFRSIGSKYGQCTDDVTDSVCILRYLYEHTGIEVGTRISEPEVPLKQHQILLVSSLEETRDDAKVFRYNPEMSLEQNATVMSNDSETFSRAKVKVRDLELSAIYKYCAGKHERYEEELNLWVINKGG